MMVATSLRRLSLSFLLALAALPSSFMVDRVFAQEEPDCDSPTTQADMNACAVIEYETADKDLNAAYQQVRKKMSAWDKGADDDSKGAVDALLAAQRAWVSFRDANCEAAGFQARGGTMEPMLVSSCLADMSKKRAEELRALADGF